MIDRLKQQFLLFKIVAMERNLQYFLQTKQVNRVIKLAGLLPSHSNYSGVSFRLRRTFAESKTFIDRSRCARIPIESNLESLVEFRSVLLETIKQGSKIIDTRTKESPFGQIELERSDG